MSEKRIRKPKRSSDFVYEIPVKKSKKILKSQISKKKPAQDLTLGAIKITNPQKTTPEIQNAKKVTTIPKSKVVAVTNLTPADPVSSEDSDINIEKTSDTDEDSESEVNAALNKIYTSFSSASAFSAGLQNFIAKKRSLNLHKQSYSG